MDNWCKVANRCDFGILTVNQIFTTNLTMLVGVLTNSVIVFGLIMNFVMSYKTLL